MPIVWTNDLKERIKGLWETNSASQIAAQLRSEGYPVSRAAISGVLNRMGLTSKNKTEDHPSACNRSRATPRQPKLKIVSSAPAIESLFGPFNVRGFDTLESHHCRYFVNDDTRDPLWCGRHSLPGKSWCEVHAALVFLPREERRAAA